MENGSAPAMFVTPRSLATLALSGNTSAHEREVHGQVDGETQTTCSSSCRSCWRVPDDVILSDPVPVQTKDTEAAADPASLDADPVLGPPNQSRHRPWLARPARSR
jgi:hypothetical protein